MGVTAIFYNFVSIEARNTKNVWFSGSDLLETAPTAVRLDDAQAQAHLVGRTFDPGKDEDYGSYDSN